MLVNSLDLVDRLNYELPSSLGRVNFVDNSLDLVDRLNYELPSSLGRVNFVDVECLI